MEAKQPQPQPPNMLEFNKKRQETIETAIQQLTNKIVHGSSETSIMSIADWSYVLEMVQQHLRFYSMQVDYKRILRKGTPIVTVDHKTGEARYEKV